MNVTLREPGRDPWTVERFLQWEDGQEGRHEFDGARVVEVTGGSRTHQRIVTNLVRVLEDLLDPERFDVMMEMRLEVAGRIRYPDVAVTAGPVFGAVRTLRDALVLFEVASDDTADMDRGDKRVEYAQLPGIRRYVMLEQSSMAATVLERTATGWTETQPADELPLPELGVTLPFAAIYRNVRFA